MPPQSWCEPCLLKLAELTDGRARLVMRRDGWRVRIVRIIGDNDIGHDDAPAGA